MTEMLPNILRAMVSTTMNVVLMLSLLQPKYSKKVTRLAMLGILAIDFGSALYCYLIGDLTLLARLDTLLFGVLCFAVRPLFKDTFMQWLFSYITIQNISDMVIVVSFVFSRPMPYPAYGNVAIRLVLFLLFYWLLRFKVRPLYRQVVAHWNVFFLVALSVWATYTYVVVGSDDIVETLTTQGVPLLLFTTVAITAYVSVCHALAVLSKEHMLQEETLRSEARQKLLQSELAAQESFIDQAKQSRHDMRHHNAILLEYLKEGDLNKATDYLRANNAALANTALKQFCENVTANAILRIYDRKAQAGGISLLVQAEIPKELPLDEPEIGALLSNLLENAMEACEKQTASPHISLVAQWEENGLQLEVRNSVDTEVVFENGFPKSTKAVGGTGTKSIAAIVEKHHGMLCFKQEREEFVVRILLPA